MLRWCLSQREFVHPEHEIHMSNSKIVKCLNDNTKLGSHFMQLFLLKH